MSTFRQLMMRKKEEIMYATIKGTLTESDGVFSGFSSSNYLALQEPFAPTGSWEIVTKITTGNSLINNVKYFLGNFDSERSLVVGTTDSPIITFKAFISTNGGVSFNIQLVSNVEAQTNTEYYIRVGFTGTTYYLDFSTDGINYVGRAEYSSTSKISPYILYYGRVFSSNNLWNGSIDLNRSYIKLGSTKYNLQAVVGYTVVGSPTITDGVVSGFSSGNYLKINVPTEIKYNKLEINCKFKSANSSVYQRLLLNNFNLLFVITSNILSVNFYTNSNSWWSSNGGSIVADTWYYKRIIFDITNKTLEIFGSADGINYTLITRDANRPFNESIGIKTNGVIFCDQDNSSNITLDLNETSIKINNKLWFNGQEG